MLIFWIATHKKKQHDEKTFNYFEIVSTQYTLGVKDMKKTLQNLTDDFTRFPFYLIYRFIFFFTFDNFAGVSSAFLHQYGVKDGYNSFDDTSTIFPSHNSITGSKWNEPYFDTNVANNVTALVSKSAYLSCKVRNLGNKTVSNYIIVTF